MFWPAKIYHATLLVPEEKKNALILALHEEGVCQLSESKRNLPKQNNEKVREIELRLTELLVKLEPYKEVPQPENLIKKMFFPCKPEKTVVEIRTNKQITQEVEEKLIKLEKPLLNKLNELEQKREKIIEHKQKINELLSFPELNTNLLEPDKQIHTTIGAITSTSIPELEQKLENKPVIFLTHEMTKEKQFIALLYPPEKEKHITKNLHEIGFEQLDIQYHPSTPKQQALSIKQQWIQERQEGISLKKELRKATKENYHALELFQEEITICRERIDALNSLGGGKSFSILEAWIPAKEAEHFNTIVNRLSQEHYLELKEQQEAPTLLKNPSIVKPFELLTELYSYPKYGRLDPTPILALTYAIFFGFMLTDAIYGILLVLGAYGIYRGMGKYQPGLRQFCALLIICGVATAILGALLGSYLGDLPKQLGIQVPMLLDPMTDILLLVAITVGIGVLHLALGLVLGIIDKVKHKEYYKAISDQGVWLLFLTGMILAIIGSFIPLFTTPGIGLIILSAILKMAFVFKDEGIVSSILSIFGFSGFVGDIFSYTRLMALAVGTAGIALAVNFMALMVIDLIPIVGIVIGITILLVGHTFNMGMNGLGAFVHGLRLHFLEFFTKFYDGGGIPYKPFYATRKITELKR
ncbi:V-type ATP synthase subunit I [archaeon]|nr:V-type ATP synthase subunit I [archaeon]